MRAESSMDVWAAFGFRLSAFGFRLAASGDRLRTDVEAEVALSTFSSSCHKGVTYDGVFQRVKYLNIDDWTRTA